MADDLLKDALEAYDRCAEANSDNAREWESDVDFAMLENQWPERVKRDRELEGRPCLTVSLLGPMIRQVVNDARQNKPGIEVHPVDSNADPETAEIFNGLIRNIEQSSNAEVAYDTALEHAVSGGFGYWRVNTAYTSDDTFDQDLTIERISNPLSVTPDCYSTAADSSDWNVCFVTDVLTRDAFEKQYKGADPVSWKDEPYNGLESPWLDGDYVQVAEWWSRDEVQRPIVLLSDGNVMAADEYAKQKDLFDALGVQVAGQRAVRSHKVTQRTMSGAEVLDEVAWAGRYIPIVPVYGSEINFKGKRHFRSMIRSAKDSQRMRNYWRTTSTEVVALAPKAPFIGPKGAFTTDAAKWATANTQSHAYIEFDGNMPPERQPFAGIPAGALQEALTASDDIKAIVGIYDASLGARSNETSGVAIDARDRQADTGTFHFIDNLSRAIRHTGRILIDLIPQVYAAPRVVRVIGSDNTPSLRPVMNSQGQGQPQDPNALPPQVQQALAAKQAQMTQMGEIARIYDLGAGKYDLTVKAGPSFASQREQFFEMATELLRAFPQAAPVIGDLLIKNYDIPDADEIAKRLQAIAANQMGQGQDPKAGEAQQQVQSLMLQVAALKADKENEAQRNQIEAYKAETDRYEAVHRVHTVPAGTA